MSIPLRFSVRVSKNLAEKVHLKLEKTGLDASEVLRSALRQFAHDSSGKRMVEVQVFDLLVGAENALRDLVDRARSVKLEESEAAKLMARLKQFQQSLERARKKARKRVEAVLGEEGQKL